MRFEKGFTLIELMVSVGVGAIVVTGLSMLAAGSSRAFHEEHRISEAQLEVRFAVERLRADLQRAGYLGTPNSATDQNVDPKPPTPLVAVDLEDGVGDQWLPGKNTTADPDRIVLLGAFRDSEVYLTESIVGTDVVIDDQTESARKWANPPRQEVFEQIFAPDTFLRIENPAGFSQIIAIDSADFGARRIRLQAAVVQAVGEQAQGVMLLGRGHRVNVLSFVDYQVMQSPVGSLLARDETDGRKLDLVRRELHSDGVTAIACSERVVAEYVVDFDVSFLQDTAIAPNPPNLVLLDSPTSAAIANPQSIRGIRFRLSTRTREEDAGYPWIAPAGGPLFRYKLDDITPNAARVRTIETEFVVPGLGR